LSDPIINWFSRNSVNPPLGLNQTYIPVPYASAVIHKRDDDPNPNPNPNPNLKANPNKKGSLRSPYKYTVPVRKREKKETNLVWGNLDVGCFSPPSLYVIYVIAHLGTELVSLCVSQALCFTGAGWA